MVHACPNITNEHHNGASAAVKTKLAKKINVEGLAIFDNEILVNSF